MYLYRDHAESHAESQDSSRVGNKPDDGNLLIPPKLILTMNYHAQFYDSPDLGDHRVLDVDIDKGEKAGVTLFHPSHQLLCCREHACSLHLDL